ncbi:MAG: 3D domain-containing protein [Negativicutes bacterium]|nr:3D domain-containing protein [Negativicutes bacterium]
MANTRHRTAKKARKKFRRLAAAVAGAAIMSGALLGAGPAATVHAAAAANPVNPPITASQQISDQHQAGNAGPVNLQAHPNASATAQSKEKAPDNYKKVLDIRATAYAPGPHDNDQWGSKTFMGTQVRPGIIAVDPSIIPLGSQVYIQYPDGHGEYARAEDTGGAIKGNRIDVARATVEKAQDFGLQQVKVYVL